MRTPSGRLAHGACTYASRRNGCSICGRTERSGAERIGPDAKRLRSVPDTNVLLPAKTVSVNKPASVEAQSSKKGCDPFTTGLSIQNFVTDLTVVPTETFALEAALYKRNRFRC